MWRAELLAKLRGGRGPCLTSPRHHGALPWSDVDGWVPARSISYRGTPQELCARDGGVAALPEGVVGVSTIKSVFGSAGRPSTGDAPSPWTPMDVDCGGANLARGADMTTACSPVRDKHVHPRHGSASAS